MDVNLDVVFARAYFYKTEMYFSMCHIILLGFSFPLEIIKYFTYRPGARGVSIRGNDTNFHAYSINVYTSGIS